MEDGRGHVAWRLSDESFPLADGQRSRPHLAVAGAVVSLRRLHGRAPYLGRDAAGHTCPSPLVFKRTLMRTQVNPPLSIASPLRETAADFGNRFSIENLDRSTAALGNEAGRHTQRRVRIIHYPETSRA